MENSVKVTGSMQYVLKDQYSRYNSVTWSVKNKIPPFFQYKESPCIFYSYTRSVASKIFNYKALFHQLDYQGLS